MCKRYTWIIPKHMKNIGEHILDRTSPFDLSRGCLQDTGKYNFVNEDNSLQYRNKFHTFLF